MLLEVPNSKIKYRPSDKGGWEKTYEGDDIWYFTFRSLSEIVEMHPTIQFNGQNVDTDDLEALERELYGETLDEPIPDDLWDMLQVN